MGLRTAWTSNLLSQLEASYVSTSPTAEAKTVLFVGTEFVLGGKYPGPAGNAVALFQRNGSKPIKTL